MTAELKLVNISGTTLNFIGSQAVALSLLVGLSGNRVIPLAVTGEGYLLTSGVN